MKKYWIVLTNTLVKKYLHNSYAGGNAGPAGIVIFRTVEPETDGCELRPPIPEESPTAQRQRHPAGQPIYYI